MRNVHFLFSKWRLYEILLRKKFPAVEGEIPLYGGELAKRFADLEQILKLSKNGTGNKKCTKCGVFLRTVLKI